MRNFIFQLHPTIPPKRYYSSSTMTSLSIMPTSESFSFTAIQQSHKKIASFPHYKRTWFFSCKKLQPIIYVWYKLCGFMHYSVHWLSICDVYCDIYCNVIYCLTHMSWATAFSMRKNHIQFSCNASVWIICMSFYFSFCVLQPNDKIWII